MKRRTFLAATAATLAAGGALLGLNLNSYQNIVKNVVRTKLDYLKISDEELDKFAQAYETVMAKPKAKVLLIDLSYKCSSINFCNKKLGERLSYFEQYVITYFLKGSDFFINGMDESREVKFLTLDFLDPYKAPCYNPFAKLS